MSPPVRTLIMVPNVNPLPDARGMGIGGAERMALQLCAQLERSRIAPQLLVFRDPGSSRAALTSQSVPVHVIPKLGRLPLAFWLSLRQLILRERIDAVLSLLQGTNLHNLIVANSLPRLACLISFRSQTPARSFIETEGRLAGRADALIALNDESAAALAASYRIARERIVVIPNGVDPASFPFVPYAGRHAARAALGLPLDAFILYSSARIAAVKGHKVLAQALRQLWDAGGAAERLLWVNTGAVQDQQIHQTILSALGPHQGKALLLPHTDAPASYLAAADAYVMPSRSESFGLALLEAAFSGRPAVSTAVGAAPILLGAGRGLLARPDDPGSLAEALRQLLSLGTESLEGMGKALHYFAQQHYSIQACASRYADCIEAAVGRRRGQH